MKLVALAVVALLSVGCSKLEATGSGGVVTVREATEFWADSWCHRWIGDCNTQGVTRESCEAQVVSKVCAVTDCNAEYKPIDELEACEPTIESAECWEEIGTIDADGIPVGPCRPAFAR